MEGGRDMTLGQRISLYRKKLNISQEELGARLGVSRQAVSKWETDLSAPDLNNLIGLAREDVYKRQRYLSRHASFFPLSYVKAAYSLSVSKKSFRPAEQVFRTS